MKTVLGIITQNNKILIGKLKSEQIANFGGIEYVFPGGKIEETETDENAVIRELQEETGLTCVVIAKIGERVHPKTGKLIQYYHCNAIAGVEDVSSIENDDIETLLWIEIRDIKEYMPTLFNAVESYILTL